jgi:hypothetical protein
MIGSCAEPRARALRSRAGPPGVDDPWGEGLETAFYRDYHKHSQARGFMATSDGALCLTGFPRWNRPWRIKLLNRRGHSSATLGSMPRTSAGKPRTGARERTMPELSWRTTRIRRGVLDRLRGFDRLYKTKVTDGEHVAYGRGRTPEASQESALRNWEAKFGQEEAER